MVFFLFGPKKVLGCGWPVGQPIDSGRRLTDGGWRFAASRHLLSVNHQQLVDPKS